MWTFFVSAAGLDLTLFRVECGVLAGGTSSTTLLYAGTVTVTVTRAAVAAADGKHREGMAVTWFI